MDTQREIQTADRQIGRQIERQTDKNRNRNNIDRQAGREEDIYMQSNNSKSRTLISPLPHPSCCSNPKHHPPHRLTV